MVEIEAEKERNKGEGRGGVNLSSRQKFPSRERDQRRNSE